MKTKALLISLITLFSFTSAFAVTMKIEVANKSSINCTVNVTNKGTLSNQEISDRIGTPGNFSKSLSSDWFSNLTANGTITCPERNKLTFDIINTGSNLNVKENRVEDDIKFTSRSVECDDETKYFCFVVTITDKA